MICITDKKTEQKTKFSNTHAFKPRTADLRTPNVYITNFYKTTAQKKGKLNYRDKGYMYFRFGPKTKDIN